jgi:lactoylglutathione lyase
MHIAHIALWTEDVERLKAFYEVYFGVRAGSKYTNPAKGCESYFLSFASGARLELMRSTTIPMAEVVPGVQRLGYIHLAMAVGSPEGVDGLTERLRHAGYPVVDGPRWTGDGYYESVVLDPDGNRLESTAQGMTRGIAERTAL